MFGTAVIDNRKLCEMYRILLCVDERTGYVAYRHHPTVAEDAASRDYIALNYCIDEGYVKFFKRTGPEFAGDPVQVISTYTLTPAGDRFLQRYRKA